MIKITQGQAHLVLNSPVSARLFNDEKRPFPIVDALKIADFIEQIKVRQQPYLTAMRLIVSRNKGTVHDNGNVSYDEEKDRDQAAIEMAEINQQELELNGDKLTIQDDWPKITLAEATILNPFVEL